MKEEIIDEKVKVCEAFCNNSLEYPLNLLQAVFGIKEQHVKLVEDVQETTELLDSSLSSLDETERKVILTVFRDKESFKETADKLGLTDKEIVFFIAKALRALRHPTQSRVLKRIFKSEYLSQDF